MVFKQVIQKKDFINVRKGYITISKTLIPDKISRIKVFIDDETKQVGLQLIDNDEQDTYKLIKAGGTLRITCAAVTSIVKEGYYYPKWSDKHKMFIFSF